MPVRTIVVTGVAGSIGQRLLTHLGSDATDRVVGIDLRPSPLRPPNLEMITADVAATDLTPAFAGADTVVHLAWSLAPPRHSAAGVRNVDATRRVLDAASAAGARALVHRSSATVYGAWPSNPVPLTEDAAVRPNPGVMDAVHHAEAERMVADWADDHPDAAVAVLRPAATLGPGVDTWLTRALGGRPALRPDRADPPRQFVHVDDVASAVALAVRERLDGVYNVSADGWVAGEVVRGLSAGRLALPIPTRLVGAAARWTWAARVSDLPPALLPFLEHPWVIANDRLRGAGWRPVHSNEEAVVAGRPGSKWREMSPNRRQEVALAAAGGGILLGAAGVAAAAARARRRR